VQCVVPAWNDENVPAFCNVNGGVARVLVQELCGTYVHRRVEEMKYWGCLMFTFCIAADLFGASYGTWPAQEAREETSSGGKAHWVNPDVGYWLACSYVCMCIIWCVKVKVKVKLSLLIGRKGLLGCERLVLPYFQAFGSYMAARLSVLCEGHFLPPGRFLVLIFARGWVDPKALVWLEGLSKLNKSTSSGTWPGDLPACSSVSQPTMLSRAPYNLLCSSI
jgi:hypothetical protein